MHRSDQDISKARFEETGYSYTMSLIQGKHKMVILYCLMEFQPVRFNEMKRYLGNIADRTLSANLKELERCERAEIVPEKPLTVQVDGELYDDLPFTVEIVKDTLRMYRGRA